MRAPELPIGCLKETAPPAILTLEESNPKICSFERATTLNASLNSNKLISETDNPAFFNATGRACDGAIGKSIGSTAASPYAI